MNQQIRAAKLWDLRRQVDVAAKTLGLSAFLIFSFLEAIESLIRRGLIYHLATTVMFDLGILIAMGFAYQWRGVIGLGLTKIIPGALGLRLEKLCNSRWGLVLSVPAFLLLVVSLLLSELMAWSSHFEVFMRIAAEVFRYQLESTIDKIGTAEVTRLSPEYRKSFPLFGAVKPEQLIVPTIPDLDEILELLQNRPDEAGTLHSLAIVGHKGVGKTCLLDYLELKIPNERIVRATIPAKLTSRKQALEFFGELLNLPPTENANALRETDLAGTKTLVLLDDAHNLFLSVEGGFAGFDTLLELLSQPANDLFWCLAFNHHAWSYLNSVNARHPLFRCGHSFDTLVGTIDSGADSVVARQDGVSAFL